MSNRTIVSILIGVLLACGFSGGAFAIPCTQGLVSGSSVCQDPVATNSGSNDSAGLLNAENFFGFSDWVYISKYDVDDNKLEQPIDVDWTVLPDTSWPDDNGTWSFNSSLWSSYSDVMIVVKSGKHQVQGGKIKFSGYLLDNTAVPKPTSGTWDTGEKELSHLSLYARGQGTPPPPPPNAVPEPGAVLLFSIGILGLLGLRRKKVKI